MDNCPPSPNCVYSLQQPASDSHFVEPLKCNLPLEQARAEILRFLSEDKLIKVTFSEGPSIRAEVHSRLFGFVDDLDFLIDEKAKLVHVRSASRTGYGDLGVNRRRIEAIRSALKLTKVSDK